ncbi:MAG: glycosyltransferase family 2 protein [Candidatus Helarchaeota archaeon]
MVIKIYLETNNISKFAQQSTKLLKSKLKVSVVICTRNRVRALLRCVKSILNQSYPNFEIIVINDYSNQKMTKFLRYFFRQIKNPHIKYYENREHLGICHSRNLGIKYATGEIIAFIDDDAIANEDWLEIITAEYTNDKIVGVGGSIIECGRKILTKNNYNRNILNERGFICHNVRVQNIKELSYLSRGFVDFFMGGNMSFRRIALARVGGFDHYIMGNGYREESDLCLSIKRCGKLIFQPEAKVFHFSSKRGGNQEIIKNDLCKFIFWDIRNTVIFYLKHLNFLDSIYKSVFQLKNFMNNSLHNEILIKSRPNMESSSKFKLFTSLFLGFIQGLAIGIGHKLRIIK